MLLNVRIQTPHAEAVGILLITYQQQSLPLYLETLGSQYCLVHLLCVLVDPVVVHTYSYY
jgi:hypothetical protein